MLRQDYKDWTSNVRSKKKLLFPCKPSQWMFAWQKIKPEMAKTSFPPCPLLNYVTCLWHSKFSVSFTNSSHSL